MHGLPRPSQWALKRAARLGAAMAQTDQRIAPDVRMAEGYVSYVQFIYVHRRRLEQLPVFAQWEAHLLDLIEREQEMLGMELLERRHWDEFYNCIAEPMRCSFWYGWELEVNLHAQFQRQAAHAAEHAQRAQTIEVAEDALLHAELSDAAADEEAQWLALARNACTLGEAQESVR